MAFKVALSTAVAIVLIGSVATVPFPAVARTSHEDVETYVLAVGTNQSVDRSLPRLRFAVTDAERFADAMETVGDVQRSRITLLRNASVKSFRAEIGKLNDKLGTSRLGPAGGSRLIFYFSGHSDTRGLHLTDGYISREDIQSILGNGSARSRIVFLDSCQAAGLTAKGVRQISPEPVARLAEPSGSVALTASSADEQAFESARLRGSLFTNALVDGLYGRADSNLDGLVTIDELYQHIYREARLKELVDPSEGLQHPEMSAHLAGQGALILFYPKAVVQPVRVAEGLKGRMTFASKSGVRFFHFAKIDDASVTVELPPGSYDVHIVSGGNVGVTSFNLANGDAPRLAAADFTWRALEHDGAVPKGVQSGSEWRYAAGQHSGYFGNEAAGPFFEVLHARSFVRWAGQDVDLRGRGVLAVSRRRQWESEHRASSEVAQFGMGAGVDVRQERREWAPSIGLDVLGNRLQQSWRYEGADDATFISWPLEVRLQLAATFAAGGSGFDWGLAASRSILFIDEVISGRQVLYADILYAFLAF